VMIDGKTLKRWNVSNTLFQVSKAGKWFSTQQLTTGKSTEFKEANVALRTIVKKKWHYLKQ
jgi:hypothetical protein